MGPSQRTLIACSLLSASLGTIHAYSIFIEPLEAELGAQRWTVSAVYSVALVSLTAAVLLGHRLFTLWASRQLALAVGLVAAGGLLVAAQAGSIAVLVLGYGLIFGSANGMGYAFSLQTAAQANANRPGFAMGAVTAAYALGAAVAALMLDDVVLMQGPATTFNLLALTLVVAGVLAALLMPPIRLESASSKHITLPDEERVTTSVIARLWLAYGCAVVAGLMALGHAAPIVESTGASAAFSLKSVSIASFGNAVGGLAVASMADRLRPRRLLIGLPVASVIALLFLAVARGGIDAAIGLAVVAMVYGAVIAFYPFVVMRVAGQQGYAPTYGRVFTAWGVAGIAGPITAGALFDATQSYRLPLLIAAVAALGSAIVAARLPTVP